MIFSIRYPADTGIRGILQAGYLLSVAVFSAINIFAQFTPGMLQQYLSEDLQYEKSGILYKEDVGQFYILTHYQTAWVQQKDTARCSRLLGYLSSAAYWGLNEKDYQYGFVSAFKNGTYPLKNIEDSLKAEILFTDAAIHFYCDVAYGNTVPSLGYTGIKYRPDCEDIPASLAKSATEDKSDLPVPDIASSMVEIGVIRNKIRWMAGVMDQKDFKEVAITSGKINTENKLFWQKMYQLGFLDSAGERVPEDAMGQKIKEMRIMFNLSENDELKQDDIRELNVPLKTRLDQLTISLNYYRWLSCLTRSQQVIVVNIPAAYLKVYQDSKVILEMRVVVGKPSTPTFTVSGIVNEVVLYPYWYVPVSIAAKELLPEIKRDKSFLDANGYQVLDKGGKVVSPDSVNWNALSRNYFPYIIRQNTGCDNSLGLLKLNFYNPFGAYLHDTPSKELFKQRRRFYSHGCMRIEKPVELGRLILKDNQSVIDTIIKKGCLVNQLPITAPADTRMPLIVWYNPAGVDSTGHVLFFEDVYRKFNWRK